MRRLWVLFVGLVACHGDRGPAAPHGVSSPLVAGGVVEKVARGFQFTEGPLWFGGRLLFADIPADAILQLSPTGTVTRFRSPSQKANGLAIDRQGRLLASESATHRLTRTRQDGTIEVVAAGFEGHGFNGPNDLIVRSDGTIYLTDPDGEANPDDRQPFQGVFRVDPKGNLSVFARDMTEPNGIALSPDETKLYVVDWGRKLVEQYWLRADGTPDGSSILATTAEWPDGMTVDDAGDVFVATQVGVQVFGRNGEHLDLVQLPEQPSNCSFGDADGRTLFITGRTSVYRVRVRERGRP
jgi:gluconolactonase